MTAAAAILYFFKDLAAVISIILILKSFCRETVSASKVKITICAAIMMIYTAACFIFLLPATAHAYEILDAISNAYYIICIFVFFKKPSVPRSLAIVFLYCFTVDMLWSFVSPVFNASVIAELIFNILLFGVIGLLIYRAAAGDDVNVLAGAFGEIPKWVIVFLLLFEMTCYYKEFGVSAKWYDFLFAVSACMIVICISYLVIRIFMLVYTQKTILMRLNEQIEYSDSLKRSDEQLRSFRHDFRNHLIVINSMFEQGDIQGAKKYFSQITTETAGIVNRFSTGSTVVDSLLDIKNKTAADSNTKIDFSGLIVEKGIAPRDMCVCMGNLIDNAIEACEKLPGEQTKTISVDAKYKNSTLIIVMTNPSAEKGKNRKLFSTTKKDKTSHGIGIKNVRKVTEKYDGSLDLELSGGLFTARLILQSKVSL